MKKFVVAFLMSGVMILLLYVTLLLYIAKQAEMSTTVKSDVVIVLGGNAIGGLTCYGPICKKGFVPKPRLNPCLVARVDHAVALYKKQLASKILMSGGTDKETNANEAQTMKQIAISAGVPETDIVMENKSTSTYENLAFSQKILKSIGARSAIIVTDPYANARASLVASKMGYQYSLSPVTESACWEQDKYKPFTNRDSRREAFAIIYYLLMGRIL